MLQRVLAWALIPIITGCSAFYGGAPPLAFDEDLVHWHHQVFAKPTQYTVVRRKSGEPALRAVSLRSASALYRKVDVDLAQTPYINWEWKVEQTLGELDEQVRWGDDFAARVYVLLSPGSLRFKPRALCYVWASNTPPGGHWTSPYSDDVVLVGLRNGDRLAGRWVGEKRNLREDLKRHFGRDIRYIEGVAIMTDTDNSDSATTAYYGEIHFSKE